MADAILDGMEDWGDIPGWLSAGVALASAVWAAISAIASRRARAEADNRARDAADAAVRSAEAEGRAAAAIERLAEVHEERSRVETAQRSAAAGRPPWELHRQGRDNVVLWNDSDADRFGVTVSGEQVRVPGGFRWDRVAADESVPFHVLGGDDARPQVEVSWYDAEGGTGEPRRWQGLV